MKKKFLFGTVLVAATLSSHGQFLLNNGESYSYQFESLPMVGQVYSPTPAPAGFGQFIVRMDGAPAASIGTTLRLEMFEGNTSETPLFSQTVNFPGGTMVGLNVPNAWMDLQGAIRLTMLSGSMTVNALSFEVRSAGNSPGAMNLFQGAIVPVPEPSTLALGGLGLLFLVGYRARRRR